VAALWAVPRVAEACGCFANPDPSVPVVQAGERILFAREDGIVTAHIQIQYQGDAREFGWLLPLPSQPELSLGTDELFARLLATTQPRYRLTRIFEGACFPPRGALDAGVALQDAAPAPGGGGGVVVVESSIGPYDYAILRADDKGELLAWLDDNRYFVPAGTDDVVAPYIRRGAFFLALKLQSGRSVGDLQPVVVRYASDLPMIPIILTSVAANPDMGIQVWMLGQGRAFPRNYAHTVINDAKIDWLTAGSNYNDVIIRATREAPGRHTFVTEYAGTSAIMRQQLDPPGRFGDPEVLATRTDPVDFIGYLNVTGYAQRTNFGQLAYTGQLLAILGKHLPVPEDLPTTPASFYSFPDYWMRLYPEAFVDWPPASWDAAAAAAELDERIARPTLEAGALFSRFPYLTRLYTTLSPQHMTRDPVFSENPDLPDYSNVHEGRLTFHCGDKLLDQRTPGTLVTADGWVIRYPNGVPVASPPAVEMPEARRIEVILEEGQPGAMVDNTASIAAALASIPPIPGVVVTDAGIPVPAPDAAAPGAASGDYGGCSTSRGARWSGSVMALLLGLLFALRALRSGPSSRA
jgi:hypothetical protein